MNRPHFVIEDDLSTGFFKLSIDISVRLDNILRPGGWGGMSASVYLLLLWFALELAPKGYVSLVSSCQAFAGF